MPRFMTDVQAADYPALAGAADQAEVLEDASRLYAWLQRHPLASEQRLRARAHVDGVTVDRVNAALAFLRESAQLIEIPDAPIVDALAPPRAPRDLEEFTVEELRELARLFDVEGRSTMNREQLLVALRAGPVIAEPVVEAPAEPAEPAGDELAIGT